MAIALVRLKDLPASPPLPLPSNIRPESTPVALPRSYRDRYSGLEVKVINSGPHRGLFGMVKLTLPDGERATVVLEGHASTRLPVEIDVARLRERQSVNRRPF